MKKTLAFITLLIAATTLAAQMEKVDTAAIAKIREEGLNHSQAPETLFWLSDAYGPRLNGSPGFEKAGDWAVKQLQSWGVSNVRKERWKFGKSWSLTAFHATMTAPQMMPIIGMPKGWTTSTPGVVTADVVRVNIANEADAQKYKGQLRGKIVLTQPAREVHLPDLGDGVVLRYADKDGKWAAEAFTVPPPPAARGGAAGGRGDRGGRGGAPA